VEHRKKFGVPALCVPCTIFPAMPSQYIAQEQTQGCDTERQRAKGPASCLD
jgi:hypothetical protein